MTFAHGHERALPDAAPRTTDFAAPLTFNPGDTMRHAFLFFALLTFAGAAPAAKPTEHPNVLFIALDDLNDWVGALGGHPQARTPNIDRLAASGVLFTNAHCAAPVCNPSRTAIFTGSAPWSTGVVSNRQSMRDELPNVELLPGYLRRHGYQAIGSGKMLHYFIHAASWDEYFPKKETENPFPPTIDFGPRPKNLPRAGQWQYSETDWGAFDVTDAAFGGDYGVTEWVNNQLAAPHDKPFFLACGIYRPHEPWFVPKKYFDLFPLDKIQLPPGYKPDDLADVPAGGQLLARNRYFAHIQHEDLWKQGVQAYLASIAYADAMVGRVLDALEKSPYRDNTIVVLWSDHGWHLGEKEHWQKYTGWRVCTRVPMIVRVPPGVASLPKGTRAGTKIARPVSLLSLYPTLVELCGLPANPANDAPSFLPLLKNKKAPWLGGVVTQLEAHTGDFAVSGDEWRYLHYADGGEELYHTPKDPYEWTNLAQDPRYAGELAKLRAFSPKFTPKAQAVFDHMPARKPYPPLPAGAPAPEPLAWHDASAPAPESHPTKHGVQITFANHHPTTVRLHLAVANGSRELQAELFPEAEESYPAFEGSVWVVVDASGQTLGHVVAGAANGRTIIP